MHTHPHEPWCYSLGCVYSAKTISPLGYVKRRRPGFSDKKEAERHGWSWRGSGSISRVRIKYSLSGCPTKIPTYLTHLVGTLYVLRIITVSWRLLLQPG